MLPQRIPPGTRGWGHVNHAGLEAYKNETNGNDQSGMNNVQFNINTLSMPMGTKNLETSIRENLTPIPDMINQLTEKSFGVSGQSYRALKGLRDPSDLFVAQRQPPYRLPAPPERGHYLNHYIGSRKFIPQPSDIPKYNDVLEQVQLVRSLIYKIDRDHKDMGHAWREVSREKERLLNFWTCFQHCDVRDITGARFPEDPSHILEATHESLFMLHKTLEASANIAGPLKKRLTGTSPRRSPRQQKKKTDAVVVKRPSPIRPNAPLNAFARTDIQQIVQNITSSIKQLSAACERNFRLLDLLFAHEAYQRLYGFLYKRCTEHKAHVIDFLLESSLTTFGLESNVRFRLSLEDPSCESNKSEVWLDSNAMQSLDAVEGCLLQYRSVAQRLPESGLAMPRRYTVADTHLVDVHMDKNRWKLSDINKDVGQFCNDGLITEPDILRLCRRIATAVLKFTCTPFSSLVWGFHNIVLFSDDRLEIDTLGRILQKPHFSTTLEKPSGANSGNMFYCLGLVLYELWSFFVHDEKIYKPIVGELDQVQSHFVRVKTEKEMERWVQSGRMEDTHAEIIRWCLDVPQWTVEEMRDPKRLNEMYEKVICGLERVEMRYSEPLAV